MAKIDLDKMISTYAHRAIFQLKMKVKQNKLLGNIGYLEFTDTSSQVDYTEGIVKASVVITDGINIIDNLNVKLVIEQVYNNGILKIPNAEKEAVRIGKMIDKCVSKMHSEKDVTYRETLPFIITQSVPGCSKLQGKILLPSKDSEKWNTKAMLFHLLNNRIIGLLYANHDMVVGKIEEPEFGWRGNNKSTFYLNCNIDYELKKCKVRISIPFNKAEQGFSLYTSMFRLEETVDQVAEQLRKQVPVNVVEKTSESKPSKKVTNKEVGSKETCVRREPEDDLPFCKITTYGVEYVRSTKNPGDWELADPDIDEKIAANCVNGAVTIFTEGLFKEVPVKAPEVEKEEKNDFFKKFDVYRGDVIDEGVEYPYLPIVDSYLSLVRTTVWDKLHRATMEAELSKITRGTELDYLNYDVETKLEDHFLDENVCCYNYGIEVAIGYRDKMCAMVREYRATVGYVSFNDDKVSIDPIPSIMVNIERFVNEIVKHLSQ